MVTAGKAKSREGKTPENRPFCGFFSRFLRRTQNRRVRLAEDATMARRNQAYALDLDEIILSCLEMEGFQTVKQIGLKAKGLCQNRGCRTWVDNTLRNHLTSLVNEGKIRHQTDGYEIDRGWKEGQPKAFILVEFSIPKTPGENHQKRFVDEITEGFAKQQHPGLYLLGVDVTMGAEFALIIQVYSDHLHHIGRFVKEYLLTHALVANTRTVMVWPTEAVDTSSAR
jgi:hypothetical protein